MPSNWLVFDRIRAMTRSNGIFQAERAFQDQTSLDKLVGGGEFLDSNQQAAILDQTNLQINRLERYKDYEQMDQTGEVSLALDLYADEACLSGDTRIPLLDGTCPTIAELAKRGGTFWVYSFDQKDNKYVPALANSARITGRNVKTVIVTLDDGSKIRCTPDHLFMLNDGSFVEAGDLSPGDSLKPLYKKTRYRGKKGRVLFDEKPYPTATGYEYFFNGKNFTSTHRWVYHHLNDDQPEVVHHADYTSLNNVPDNLIGMSEIDHMAIHARFGPDNPSFNDISWVDLLLAAENWHGALSKDDFCSFLDIGERVLNRLLNEQKLTWSDFRQQYNRCDNCDLLLQKGKICKSCRKKYLSDYHLRRSVETGYRERRKQNKRNLYQKCDAVREKCCKACDAVKDISQFSKNKCAYSPYCNDCRPFACPNRYRDKSFNNHAVCSVEDGGIIDEVYDISVPDYHCFAAGDESSWVIVHNSLVDPERKHTLVIRARNRRLKLELEDLMFNTLQWDTACRPTIRYLCKYGDMPYEIVLNTARDGVASLRFMNVYNFTRIETRHGDLVGFFYMDATDPTPQFFHPWQVMHSRLTSFENIFHPYGRCEAFGTRVSTPDGYKNIEDFAAGDAVHVFDGGKLVESKVVAACHSGEKKIIRIKTRHCTNECSRNHPIMVRNWIKRPFKFGTKWFSELVYKRADELKIGDELVIPRKIVVSDEIALPEISTLTYVDNRLTNVDSNFLTSSQHKLTLPRYVDEDFAQLFGFLIGDGWLNRANGNIRGVDWALGESEKVNAKYESLLRSYGLNPIRTKNQKSQSKLEDDVCRVTSVDFGLLMAEMGLCSGFDKKRIPEWVYRAKLEIQKAFIKGLVESDGSVNVDEWNCERMQLELSNYELVKDVKMLLHQIGWKCGNIIERQRDSDTTTIHGVEYVRSDSWIIYFYESDLFESAGRHVQRESGSRGRNARKKESAKYGDGLVFEPIIALEDGGIQKTADIQVEHPASNFVADGIVVHNSVLDGGRKAFKQLRLMEDAALIYRITRAPEKRKFTIPVGMIPPKEVPEYMQMIARNWKRQRFYNPSTGAFDERYSPLIQEDDFFLPRRPDGTGPDIETLPGAENLDQIKDIEYFKKKMIAPTKIPFARVGIGESGGEASEKSLSQSHSEFAKAVQWVQRELATGLTKVAIVHLALKGYRAEDLKGFEITLTATSAMEELYRIETWQTRVSVMADLKDLGWFPKEWIVTHFTDMSPDEIEELKDMEETESSGGPGGGMPGGLDLPGEDMPEGEMPEDGVGDDLFEVGGGDEPSPSAPVEGFDYVAERRLILELKKQGKRKQAGEIVKKWAERLGRQSIKEDRQFYSGFGALLESKELDGLTNSQVKNSMEDIMSYNADEGVLVEWSVDKEERDAVIKEVFDIITNGAIDEDDMDGSDVITESDVPVS